MKKITNYIITTTINKPTKATIKFCQLAKKKGWVFVIIGDLKTPHDEYQNLVLKYLGNVLYLSPKKQKELFPELSNIIGWNTIQRRNIGFVYAYQQGAEIVATVDDDNIPYDFWGDDVWVGKEIEVDYYSPENGFVFDPISVTNNNELWHRGYPIELVKERNFRGLGYKKVIPLIQADFWNGDPDIDAIARLTFQPEVTFTFEEPFASDKISPFNSQNTFLHREILPHYAVWPFVGRMDDIWGGYYAQKVMGKDRLIYNRATVYQERNKQDLITNLENEMIGYRHNSDFIKNDLNNTFIPEKTRQFLEIYFNHFN